MSFGPLDHNQRIAPPVACYQFCTHQDGHPGQFHVSDQTCYSDVYKIPTILYPPLEAAPGEYEPNYIGIYLAAPHDGQPANINIRVGEDQGITMTLDEALVVTQAIVAAIDEATSAGM